MPSDALTTSISDIPVVSQAPNLPTTRRTAPILGESAVKTSASSCTSSRQDAIYLSFEMFLQKVMNIPDDGQSDEACVNILEADAELREKLDAYFAQCDVHKQKEQTLSAVFKRATDVHRRTVVKAVMTLPDGGLGAYAVLDKDGQDPRDETNMNHPFKQAIRSEARPVASKLSNGARQRPSNSQAESPTYKKLKLQAPSNAANCAHHYVQPHSTQVTYGDDAPDRLKLSYQRADYALQFMRNGGLRNHSFGNLICDD
ncbi:hypothetical protein CPB85DRAFT_1256700 [Mucidula mucida]|nr:hypothetical protein CPB85DRAFT_1256700 [Mucidula mucida]